MDTDFCVEAVEEALERHGAPKIFNTDQWSQFTSEAFTDLLKDNGIRISMEGRGSWNDNVFIERRWRSVKYEKVYLRAYESVPEARVGFGRYFEFYNAKRPIRALAESPRTSSTTDGCPRPRRPNLRQRYATYQTGQRCSDNRGDLLPNTELRFKQLQT